VNKKVIAKEWLILILSFVFGILILPAILTLLFTGELKELRYFYKVLFGGGHERDFFTGWLIVSSPYCLIQIIRATSWSIKQLKQQ
jgi:hypothetical protein